MKLRPTTCERAFTGVVQRVVGITFLMRIASVLDCGESSSFTRSDRVPVYRRADLDVRTLYSSPLKC
jgi:hypothetical protein